MKLIIWVNKKDLQSLEDFIKGKQSFPPVFTNTNLNINQIAVILNTDDYYKLQDNTGIS